MEEKRSILQVKRQDRRHALKDRMRDRAGVAREIIRHYSIIFGHFSITPDLTLNPKPYSIINGPLSPSLHRLLGTTP